MPRTIPTTTWNNRSVPSTSWQRPRFINAFQLQDVSGNDIVDISGNNIFAIGDGTGGSLVQKITTTWT